MQVALIQNYIGDHYTAAPMVVHWFSRGNPIILKGQTSSQVSKYCFEHSHKLGIEQLMYLCVFSSASLSEIKNHIKTMVLFSHS